MNNFGTFVLATALLMGSFLGSNWLGNEISKFEDDVSKVYGVKVVKTELSFGGTAKVIIERDGNRFKCDAPSAEEIKNKVKLSCEDPTPVTNVEAK